MSSIKAVKVAPQHLFITLKKPYPGESPIPLGFASAYEPSTKAFSKRKDTQLTWAYGYDYEEHTDGIWHNDSSGSRYWGSPVIGGHPLCLKRRLMINISQKLF